MPDNTQCACPGDLLTYTCTVVGGTTTLWEGTAFNCPMTTNEIILLHGNFANIGGTSGDCNNRAILGRSLRVEDSCYTSQLNVTVSASLNNKTVQCVHISSMGTSTVGVASLNVISAGNKKYYVHNQLVV